MDGYFGQIANRSQAIAADSEISPQPQKAMPQGSLLQDHVDLEEKDTLHQASSSSIPIQPAVNTDHPSYHQGSAEPPSGNSIELVPQQISYLDRHIIRVREEERNITHINDRTTYRDNIVSGARDMQEHLQDGDQNEFQELLPKANQPFVHATSIREPAKGEKTKQNSLQNILSVVAINNINGIVPVVKAAATVLSENKKAGPQLVIGRITVEIVPDKQKVIHKIEKRTIVQQKPVGNSPTGKFIFGLNQL